MKGLLNAFIISCATLLSACSITPNIPSGPDFDPPYPNVTIKNVNELDGAIDQKYLNLLGVWEGAFRSSRGYKKVGLTFYDIDAPNMVHAIYSWGTYYSRPYSPGQTGSKIIAFAGNKGSFDSRINIQILSPTKIRFIWKNSTTATMQKVK